MSAGMPPVHGDHEAFDQLAVGWALSSLEPEDEAAFAAHLAGCPRCARTVAETSQVMASLAAELTPAEPSDDLRARLRAAVEEAEQLPVPTASPAERRGAAPVGGAVRDGSGRDSFPPSDGSAPDDVRAGRSVTSQPGWRRAVPAALVAGAVLVIAGLGIWNIVLSEARTQAEVVVAEQAEVMSQLLRPGRAAIAPLSGDDGTPVATVVVRQGEIQVVTHGLAANDPSDSTYVVWGMGHDTPVALGTFDVRSSQMDLRTVGSVAAGVDEFPAYGISLEPGQEAPSAPTDVVATGEVSS